MLHPHRTTIRRASLLLVASLLALSACGRDTDRPTTATTTAGPIPASAHESIDVGLAAMAPHAGYAVFDAGAGCDFLAGSGLDGPVPIASAFKLWVLDALARRVADGGLDWSQPVTISDELRSDPSGETYPLPTGTEVTVRHLAEVMISISDNTATDHLIDLVGRSAIEEVIVELAPDGAAGTLPLLSTADMARLKFVRPDLGAVYARLPTDERRADLVGLAQRVPLPWIADPAAANEIDVTTPRLVDDLEWFASGADLCRTMADLARLVRTEGLEPLGDILSANSGLPAESAAQWETVWFKGGSELGVLAMVFRLAHGDSDRVVVIALSDADEPLVPRRDGEAVIGEIIDLATP